jgi:hypothetical protein
VPLLWSGAESDPHVSKPTFHVESVKVSCETSIGRLHGQKQDLSLGRPNQGQKKGDLGRAITFQGFEMAKM